jgi:ribosomal protein L21E
MANEVVSILMGKHIEVTFRGLTPVKEYERMSGVVSQCDGANIIMTTKGDKKKTLLFSISRVRHVSIS